MVCFIKMYILHKCTQCEADIIVTLQEENITWSQLLDSIAQLISRRCYKTLFSVIAVCTKSYHTQFCMCHAALNGILDVAEAIVMIWSATLLFLLYRGLGKQPPDQTTSTISHKKKRRKEYNFWNTIDIYRDACQRCSLQTSMKALQRGLDLSHSLHPQLLKPQRYEV